MPILEKKDIQWQLIFSTRKYLILAMVTAGIAVLITLIATMGQIRDSLALRDEIVKEQTSVDRLETKVASLATVEVSPEFSQLELVNSTLPSNKPLLELLTSLNDSARSANVSIQNLEINPGEIASDAATLKTTNPAEFDTLIVNLEVKGTFNQVQQFFTLVEQKSPFTTIASIKLNTQSTSQEQAQNSTSEITAELITNTFYYTKSIQAALEAPLPLVSGQQKEVLEQLARFTTTNLPNQEAVTGGGSEDPFKTR